MGSEVVVVVAIPAANGDVPRAVAPLVNVTVPLTPDGRLAVNVTDWPGAEGLVEEVSVTTGDALVTICVAVPVAGLLFESPPKEATIGSLPTGKIVVLITTVPVVGLTVPEPRVVPPLAIVTVPVVPTGRVVVIVTGLLNVVEPGVETMTVGVALLTVWVRAAVAVLLFASPL